MAAGHGSDVDSRTCTRISWLDKGFSVNVKVRVGWPFRAPRVTEKAGAVSSPRVTVMV